VILKRWDKAIQSDTSFNCTWAIYLEFHQVSEFAAGGSASSRQQKVLFAASPDSWIFKLIPHWLLIGVVRPTVAKGQLNHHFAQAR
jgi:hypothetical protein